MDVIEQYIANIENDENREIFRDLAVYILNKFPQLDVEYKWNQPMFTTDGHFIFSFTNSKNHFTVAVEAPTLEQFSDDIKNNNYDLMKKTFKIKYKQDIDYDLIDNLINFQLKLREGSDKFWY